VAAEGQTLRWRVAVASDAHVEPFDDPPPTPDETVDGIDHDDEAGLFAARCPPSEEPTSGFNDSLRGLVSPPHAEIVAHELGTSVGRPESAPTSGRYPCCQRQGSHSLRKRPRVPGTPISATKPGPPSCPDPRGGGCALGGEGDVRRGQPGAPEPLPGVDHDDGVALLRSPPSGSGAQSRDVRRTAKAPSV
jgi:hypothetical protein